MKPGHNTSIETIRKSLEAAGEPQSAMQVLRSEFVERDPLQQKIMMREVEVIRRPNVPSMQELLAQGNASNFYRQLKSRIEQFEAQLDPDNDVGLRLVAFGGPPEIQIHLSDVGFADPAMITFRGNTESSELVELIQHVSQVNVLLMALKRPEPQAPRRKIGFQALETTSSGASERAIDGDRDGYSTAR